ncbi:MAG: aminotransferase class I/II-fold pyridoxal phosphate-dependent enzyme [Peptoniphilaceae bacterium]|nr:aminotransferase class I/II-fold pyridoxal phosphate-dependent enzyme [Peptoniphilaceae bacterium]
MKYDFTTLIDRHGRDAIAVDGPPQMFCQGIKPRLPLIPAWTADMNFATCPSIVEAMVKRAGHPIFGYFRPRKEYFDTIIDWQRKRHGITELKPEHIGYENGVLGGVISALNTLCSRGDSVLLHSPAYVGFTRALTNNGYHIVHSALETDRKGIYRMNFDDMEEKIQSLHIHALLFCSPHNPTGRVWEREELAKLAALCEKYDVTIVCDEIWSDLILFGNRHIPLQSISEDAKNRTIAFYAPSKTFNLAGIVGAYHIIYNPRLRDRMLKEASLSNYNAMNIFSQYALIGTGAPESEEWLEELLTVLSENIEYGVSYIRGHFHGVEVSRPQGTYMLYLNCSEWLKKHELTLDALVRKGFEAGVVWQDGRQFQGNTHIRMNLASPKSRIEEMFDRLDRYVFNA